MPDNISTTNYLRMSSTRQCELVRMMMHSTRVDGHAIGYLPTAALTQAASRGDVQVVLHNRTIVGYSLTTLHRTTPTAKIYVEWVRPDARQVMHGRQLLAAIMARCIRWHRPWLYADVADDLPANVYWRAMGMTVYHTRPGGWTLQGYYRHRRINQYRIRLYG